MGEEDFKAVKRLMHATKISEHEAYALYSAFIYNGGEDLESLVELIDRVRSSDVYVAIYLAKYGSSVLDDEVTVEAMFNAYEYLRRRGITSITRLPEKAHWVLDELAPGASEWLTNKLRVQQNFSPSSATLYVSSKGIVRPHSRYFDVCPKARAALDALEELSPVTEADLARAMIRIHINFNYAWNETLSRLNDIGVGNNFLLILKGLYLNESKTYMGKDFYDWVIELVNADFIIYNSERNLLYALVAFREKILKEI